VVIIPGRAHLHRNGHRNFDEDVVTRAVFNNRIPEVDAWRSNTHLWQCQADLNLLKGKENNGKQEVGRYYLNPKKA